MTVAFVSRARVAQEERSAARRLRDLRDVLGLSQREVAKEFKVAHGAIASWESGARALPGPVSKLLDLYEAELGLEAAASAELETSFAARNYALRMVLTTYEFALREAPFQFTSGYMRRLIDARGRDNRGKFQVNLPQDWIFANRMALGLFALLARLEAQADFRSALLDVLYEPGEPRPAPYSEVELAFFLRRS